MKIHLEGKVIEIKPDGTYIVEVEYKGKKKNIPCTLGGKLRYNKITVIEGDRVRIEINPQPGVREIIGKIVYRLR